MNYVYKLLIGFYVLKHKHVGLINTIINYIITVITYYRQIIETSSFNN